MMEDRGVGEAIAELLAVDVAVCDRAGLAGVVWLAQRVRGWVDAVDVAIARRSRELAVEGRSDRRRRCCRGTGGVRRKRPKWCRIGPRCASRCLASRPHSPMAWCRLVIWMRSPTRPKDSMTPVASVSVSWRTRCWTSLGSSRCRCSSDAAGCWANASPVMKANQNWTSRKRRCRCAAGSTNRPGCTTPTSPSIRSGTPSCGPRSTPNSPRSNKLTATPAPESTSCWLMRSSRRCPGNGAGSGGCPRSVSTSTTKQCSMVSTSTHCVRRPMGSRCHPRRCAVWRARRRSCRSCSTAPAKSSTAAASSGWRTGHSAERCGRCTAPAATPAATSPSTAATSTTSSPGSATDRPIWTICSPLCSRHHHLVHEGRWRLTLGKHRVITIHRPDGIQHFHGTTINRKPDRTSSRQSSPKLTPRSRPETMVSQSSGTECIFDTADTSGTKCTVGGTRATMTPR
jgi:hypothetical protein